jgi:hypothetical protein
MPTTTTTGRTTMPSVSLTQFQRIQVAAAVRRGQWNGDTGLMHGPDESPAMLAERDADQDHADAMGRI